MRSLIRCSLLLVSVLFLLHSAAKAEEEFWLKQGPNNKIAFDGTSPSSPAANTVKAGGTVTPDPNGWTCTKVVVTVIDTKNGQQLDMATATLNNGVWAYSNNIFMNKAVVLVKATGTFTKGGMTDNKSVDGVLTVR